MASVVRTFSDATTIHSSKPTMLFNGSITVTRNSEKDSNVTISISGTLKLKGSSSYYNSPYSSPKTGIGFTANSTSYDDMHGNYYYITSSGTSISQSWTQSWTSGNLIIYSNCGFGSDGSTKIYCNEGHDHVAMTTIGISELPYNPYSKPSYSITSISPTIGKVGSTSYTVKYSITGGSNDLSWVKAKVYNTSGTCLKSYSFGTSKGSSLSGSFTLSSSTFSDRTQYKVSIRFYDSNTEYETDKLTFYTYTKPIINSLSLNNINFSGIGNTTLTWYTNTRRWSLENDFITYMRFGSKSYFKTSNQKPTGTSESNTTSKQTETLSESIITSQFTSTERSQEKINTTVQMKRRNDSSGEEATTSTVSVTIQMYPKYAPSKVLYYKSDSSGNRSTQITAGSLIYIDEVPYIDVEWTYPDSADRGVINGYYLRIYSDSDYSNLVKTFTISSTSLTAHQIINTKTELKRGTLNYIKITAFYTKPSDSSKKEGPALSQSFVTPLGKLQKPVIDYPKTGDWHNKNYRICFKLPIDDDFDTYSTDIQNGSYIYKDIELNINDTIYSYSSYPSIYSTTTLSYQKGIVINPSVLSTFPTATEYKIKIRVQKNYYKDIWSEWSDIVSLTQHAISNLTLTKDTYVYATQYNTMQGYMTRLYTVYPFSNRDSNDKQLSKGDVIYQKNYKAIYNTILGIQSLVNNYTTYDSDKSNIKFDQTINDFDSPNEFTTDIITEETNAKPILDGRNYINALIEDMNRLK